MLATFLRLLKILFVLIDQLLVTSQYTDFDELVQINKTNANFGFIGVPCQ